MYSIDSTNTIDVRHVAGTLRPAWVHFPIQPAHLLTHTHTHTTIFMSGTSSVCGKTEGLYFAYVHATAHRHDSQLNRFVHSILHSNTQHIRLHTKFYL